MSQGRRIFLRTEAFNCVEILSPLLESLIRYYKLEINVIVAEGKIHLVSRQAKFLLVKESGKKSLGFPEILKELKCRDKSSWTSRQIAK